MFSFFGKARCFMIGNIWGLCSWLGEDVVGCFLRVLAPNVFMCMPMRGVLVRLTTSSCLPSALLQLIPPHEASLSWKESLMLRR